MAIESDHEGINLNDEQKFVVVYEGDTVLGGGTII